MNRNLTLLLSIACKELWQEDSGFEVNLDYKAKDTTKEEKQTSATAGVETEIQTLRAGAEVSGSASLCA